MGVAVIINNTLLHAFTNMPNTDIATRASVVTLKAFGFSTSHIAAQTKISPRTIDAIFKRAKDAGFDPEARPLVIRDTYLQDLPRTGRPNKRQIFEEAVLA